MDALARKLELDPVEIRRRNFIPRELPEDDRGPQGLDDRLRRLRGDARPGARARRLRRLPRRAGRSAAKAGTQLLGVGFSTYVEMCGVAPSSGSALGAIRWVAAVGSGDDPLPPDRQGRPGTIGTAPHGQGHVTTFSQIVADGLGVTTRTSGAAQRHGGRRRSATARTAAAARPWAGSRVCNAADKVVRRRSASAAHSWRSTPRTSSLRGRQVHGRGHRTGQRRSRRSRSPPALAHNLPDGLEQPAWTRRPYYDPADCSSRRDAHRRRRGGRRDRRRRPRPVRRGRRHRRA